jgi:hypothetical protein
MRPKAVWLVAVSCVRPEELAFKLKDLNAEKRELWVVRAVYQGKLCREAMQACRSELAEANLRNRESDRAAYKERWGVYPDHHITHPLQPTGER